MDDYQILAGIALVLMAVGLIAGLLAGLLGVGGGIVIVPILFWIAPVLEVPAALTMHIAVATSLATIVFTSISSARAHHKKGAVDPALLRLWLPGIVVGAASGGYLAKHLDGETLSLVFGAIALLVAIGLARREAWLIADHLPGSRLINHVISAVVGFFSALMGIGGGTLSVPTLSLFGFPIHRAVGTASSFGVAIAAASVGFYIWAGLNVDGLPTGALGYVNLPAAFLITSVTIFAAPFGAKIAHKTPQLALRRCFAVFLAISGVNMIL